MQIDRFRIGLAGALALGLSLAAGPCAAGTSAQYGADDPHLDALLDSCAGPFAAYWQALSAANPPEIVDVSVRNLVSALRGSRAWTAAEMAQRRAVGETALNAPSAVGDPSAASAAQLSLCVLQAEAHSRQGP